MMPRWLAYVLGFVMVLMVDAISRAWGAAPAITIGSAMGFTVWYVEMTRRAA